MSAIQITSEIKPLKKVLLHRPGNELLNLTPSNLENLLFDDIPYLAAAQKEHDLFADIFRQKGIEVVYLENLMAEVLDMSEEIKKRFLEQYLFEARIYTKEYKKAVFDFLMRIPDNKELVLKTMEGINLNELNGSVFNSLENHIKNHDKLIIDPMPNLYFTRDATAAIGRGICINSMYSVTRKRETVYSEYIFNHHPDFKENVKQYYKRTDPFHIEGGDITNLNEHIIAVGVSERTCADAVEALARNLFADNDSAIDTVLAFTIPAKRAFMHLDTVFTQVDTDIFVVHPGILRTLEVFELKAASGGGVNIKQVQGSLERILASYLKLDAVSLIHCGAGNKIAAEREQWNDGSNTLCIAPGEVIVYERNNITNELLDARGIKLHPILSSELSRGRGGPRCMSMPLVRSKGV
ncbi:arginine deiminase [Treponema sp. OMZ 840]|uniref:arginine deiminase n=1 Tax=Treponema sp. OMZ 840 TaxID=244313 RepID=UPI003D8BA2FB